MKSVSYSETVKPFVALLSLGVLHLPTIQACGSWSMLKIFAASFVWAIGLGILGMELWNYLILMLLNSPFVNKEMVKLSFLFAAYKLCTLILVVLSVSRHMRRFLNEVDGYCLQNDLATRTIWLRAYQTLAWLIFLSLVSLKAYGYFLTVSCAGHLRCSLTVVAMTFSCWFEVCVSLLPLLLYLLVWLTVLLEARRFNKDLRHCNFQTLENPSETLEDFRLRHMSLCHMLNRANDVVGWYLLLAFGAGIPMISFYIRASLFKSSNPTEKAEGLFVLIVKAGVSCQFILLILTGAFLNTKMHESLTHLYGAKLRTFNNQGRDSLQVFVNYLQFQTLGFQVKGLFVINTSTMGLVAAAMSTYGVFINELPADVGQPTFFSTAFPPFNISMVTTDV